MSDQITATQFADIDAMWVDAPESSTVADGEYVVRVDVCRPEMSKTMKRMLHWEFTVLSAGPSQGRALRMNHILESPQNAGWCKSDLRRVGVDVDNPAFQFGMFITESTGILINQNIKVRVANKLKDGQNNTNVYFQGKNDVRGSALASADEVSAAQSGQVAPPATGGVNPGFAGAPAVAAQAGPTNPWAK